MPAELTANMATQDLIPGAGRITCRRDLLVMLALSGLTLATRLPLMPGLIAHSDGAGYAFGMERFEPALQRPHPPGYPLFVFSARALRAVVGDANRALLLLNVIPAAIAVPALYLLGVRMFSRPTGLTAAVLLLTCPNFWRTNLLWMSYTAGMCFSVLAALAMWERLTRSAGGGPPPERAAAPSALRPALLSALCLGLGGGFRQQLLVFLGPLWVWTLARRPWRHLVIGAAIIGACTGGWMAWAAVESGGYDRYRAAGDAQWREAIYPTSLQYAYEHGGSAGLRVALRERASTWVALLFGGGRHTTAWAWGALLLYGLAGQLRHQGRMPRTQGAFLLLWLLPMTLFSIIYHINSQCHVLEYYPPLFLIAGWGAALFVADARSVWRGLPTRWAAGAVVVLCGAFNSAVFATATYPGFRGENDRVQQVLDGIRRDFSPRDTAIIQSDLRMYFYVVQYYLRDYEAYMLEPTLDPPRPSLEEATGVHSPLRLRSGTRRLVFLDPEARVAGGTQPLLVGGEAVAAVRELRPNERVLLFDRDGVRFGDQ